MFSSQIKRFVEPLSSEESNVLRYLEAVIRLNDPDKLKKLIGKLQNYSQHSITLFSNNSEIVRLFLSTNTELTAGWVDQLKEHGAPHFPITGRDKKESYSVFDHYISDCYMWIFFHTPREKNDSNYRVWLLNQACELGSYHGLIVRNKHDCELLARLGDSLTKEKMEEKMEDLVGRIRSDAARLANLYGAIGYVKAASSLSDLSVFFSKYKEYGEFRGDIFKEESIKYSLCAYLLKDDSESNKLVDLLTKGKGVMSVISNVENIKIKSLQDVPALFERILGAESYNRVYKQAKNEIESTKQVEQKFSEMKQSK